MTPNRRTFIKVASAAAVGAALPADQLPAPWSASWLDDFEDGTITYAEPEAGGTLFNASRGTYQKVGDLVTCSFTITLSAEERRDLAGLFPPGTRIIT